MKRTAYQIAGQSFSEPTSLPDGFEVKAVEVDDPKAVTVGNIFDNKTLKVQPVPLGGVEFVVESKGSLQYVSLIVGQASALQVRDCLNAILEGDEETAFKGRVFKDISGDLWFEVEPNTFTVADDWESAREGGTHGSDFAGWTFARLACNYDDSLTDVTDIWQVDL